MKRIIIILVCSVFSVGILAKATTKDIDPKVLKLAESAYQCAEESGIAKSKNLTIIDYSLSSNQQRLWVIDMTSNKVLYNTFVAHGQGSGDIKATRFSNEAQSHASSVGLYLTGNVYEGHNGYSLRLLGLDKGFNDHALSRAVVMHGAPYVNDWIGSGGHLGRSWGCPAVPQPLAKPIIDTIKNGNLVFAYYPDKHWLKQSKYINCCSRTLAANSKPQNIS